MNIRALVLHFKCNLYFLSYVEKSQTLMEQRNEGFVTSAAQSQSKVLAIEQEKVQSQGFLSFDKNYVHAALWGLRN